MADEVYMDIPAVEKMGNDFKNFGEVLNAVAKALEAISFVLKATAWISFGSTAALSAFVDRIKPNVQRAANKMIELSGDVQSAIRAYRDGDYSGSRRFC